MKIEDSKEGINEEDEVNNFKITNVYDLDFILKLIIVGTERSIKSVLFVNFLLFSPLLRELSYKI